MGADEASVTVSITEDWNPFFGSFLGVKMTPIRLQATAQLVGEANVCVLALDPALAGAVAMDNSAKIEAAGCAVHSNSLHAKGIELKNKAAINSPLVCSAGGIDDKNKSTVSSSRTDCPVMDNPLALRPEPAVGTCDFTDRTISGGTHVLTPGVYCGGLKIEGNALASFEAGTYVIRDGMFHIADNSTVTGKDTGFFLTGKDSYLKFEGDASISLSGAESGPLTGLLFFASPKKPAGYDHLIRATKVQDLTGTIYLPEGSLRVDPNAAVGEKSAYTAIVVKSLRVEKGPTLVLNTNYSDTKVPVPAGIQSSAQVVLSR
jgi:hypothetical protein